MTVNGMGWHTRRLWLVHTMEGNALRSHVARSPQTHHKRARAHTRTPRTRTHKHPRARTHARTSTHACVHRLQLRRLLLERCKCGGVAVVPMPIRAGYLDLQAQARESTRPRKDQARVQTGTVRNRDATDRFA
jgi:hypothetical protein